MLENIHDIAPGANLRVRHRPTSASSAFASNIDGPGRPRDRNIIVDDLGFSDEPMFQDGLIAQAINTVTSQGVTYFSAAGNEGQQRLPVDLPRATHGTITGIGTGTFMNFNPSGGDDLRAADHDRRSANADRSSSSTTSRSRPRSRPDRPRPVTSNVYIYVLDSRPATSSSAPREQQQRRHPGAAAVRHHPQRRQLFRRDPGRLGTEPGARRVRRMSTNNVNCHGQPAVRQRRRDLLSDLVRTHDGGRTRSASARRPGGRRRRTSGQNPLANEPFSSYGPGDLRLQRRRHAAATPDDGPEPDDHGPRRRQHLVLRARRSSSTPPTRRSPASRRRRPTSHRPAELLRHVVGRAQRRGRRGADAADGPQPHARRDPPGLDRPRRRRR